jgi:hypothetical protein
MLCNTLHVVLRVRRARFGFGDGPGDLSEADPAGDRAWRGRDGLDLPGRDRAGREHGLDWLRE